MTAVALPVPPLPSRTVVAAEPFTGEVTPAELLKMDQRGLFELVDGKLIEKPVSFLAGDTTGVVYLRVGTYVQQHRLGKAVLEVTFQCFPRTPNRVRRPDIAFVATARLGGVPAEGHVPIRPDLAIEVVSPGDGVIELEIKLDDYRSAGVPLVWVFLPELRQVRVHRPDGSVTPLGPSDTLVGGDVLPGFSAIVEDLFPAAAPEPT